MKHKVALVILDGYGLNPRSDHNAVAQANKPFLDKFFSSHPYTTLTAHGLKVGLPEGQIGNSEVGHLNIGAGRVVKQVLVRLNEAVENNALIENDVLKKYFTDVKSDPTKTLHLVGFISKGGVHSLTAHLEGIIDAALRSGVKRIAIHGATDGRDRPPMEAKVEIAEFIEFLDRKREEFKPELLALTTLIGRYYQGDRDNRWERTQTAFDLIFSNKGREYPACSKEVLNEALTNSYNKNITDEFFEASYFKTNGYTKPNEGDSVVFFHFRTDRLRQLVESTEAGFSSFDTSSKPNKLNIATLTMYKKEFNVDVIIGDEKISNTLSEVLSDNKINHLKIAETEKYPHVTFFLNGMVEKENPGEKRIIIPSPKDVPQYYLKPEMSAYEITDAIVSELEKDIHQAMIINLANCDMVGHSGNLEASIKAVETVDKCAERLVTEFRKHGFTAIITADHGNAEQLIDYDTGEPHTYHTTHPIPFCIDLPKEVNKEGNAQSVANTLKSNMALCDIAPTILHLMGIERPKEMTGESIINHLN